jgi:hypothetical protein
MLVYPAACPSPGSGGSGANNWLSNILLLSTLDPYRYKTPDKFDPNAIHVYHLGRRMELGLEYICEESGGLGTGYDQIKLIDLRANIRSRFLADYVPV